MADTYKNPNFKYVGRTKQYHKDSGKIGLGTCTLISKNWILTAYHVAKFRHQNPNAGRLAVYFRGSTVESTVRNVYKAPGVDVALCEIKPAISADGNKAIPPVALMSGKFTNSADGTITFTMIGHQGGLHYHRGRKGHGINGGESFYHSKDASGNRPGKAGDSGGAFVIERTGSTLNSQDVQFSVIHGSGYGPQVGPLKDWINNKIADSTPGQAVTWVTKSHTKNGTPSDIYTWTGYASLKTWKKLGNWSPNGNPGVDGSLNTNNDEVAQLAWMGAKDKVYAEPRLENNWSLGQITFSANKDNDMTIRNSNNWNPSTGDGRKRILLNGKDSTAFNVESDTDGTFTYTIEEGIRILVDNDLYWDVNGDETLRIEGRVNGTGKITKRGSGTLTFANIGDNVTNNGTNPLDILGGTVIVAKKPNAPNIGGDVLINGADAVLELNQDEQVSDTVAVTVQNGRLDLSDRTETIGGLVLDTAATLASEIAGGEGVPDADFGRLIVNDSALLDGTLELSYADGSVASVGDTFLILDANSLSGTFDDISFPDEQVWFADYDTDAGTLTVGVTAPFYVDVDATGANDGTSWEDAYNYLQDALVGAQSGDEIRVAQGVYRPDEFVLLLRPNLGRMETFHLRNGVAIRGGYAGFGEAYPNARDIKLYKTILSGDLNGDDGPDFANNGENSYHVVTGSGTDATAVLDGFTITAGNANGANPYDRGAGMSNDAGSPTVANCTFSGNSADYHGGGMYNLDSRPTLIGCAFSGNSASENGGGIVNYDNSSPTVTNCTFTGNSANNYGGGMFNHKHSNSTVTNCVFSGNSAKYGGAVHNKNSNPTITDCTFRWNSASENGGGIVNYNNSSPTVTNCTFTGNSVNNYGGGMFNNDHSNSTVTNCVFSGNSANYGGGMLNDSSSPTVTGCTFTGNEADSDGGGMRNRDSSPTITNCTFSGNSAMSAGGGMYNWEGSSPALTNCIFTENSAARAGGIRNSRNSNPTFTNCTFSRNLASDKGGVMRNSRNCSPALINCTLSENWAQIQGGGVCNDQSSSPMLTNCILWGNTAPTGPQIDNDGTSSSIVTYSDVQGGWPGVGNIDADPCFVEPGYWDTNETPDDQSDDFWVAGDHHLLPDSPCINAGDPNFIAGPNDTDIDGESRVMLGRVDMGADEFNPFKVEFDVVEKRRIGRTVFEYECEVTLENISRFAVKNIQLTLAEASDNMTIIEPNVTFGDIEVGPGESAISIDTCTFSVDRSQAINPAKIIWHSTCEMANTGQIMEQTASSTVFLGLEKIPGDLVVDGQVDFADLAKLAGQWLWQGQEGSIPEDIVEDGAVNLADFAEFAQKWGRN